MELSTQDPSSTPSLSGTSFNDKNNQDSAENFNNIGNAFTLDGDILAALEAYKQAITIDPYYAPALSNMGSTVHKMGELEAALELYKQALNIEPNCAETYENIGLAFLEMGNTEVASAAYQQSLNIKPDNVSAQYLFAALTGQQTASAPNEYIEELFDRYAAKFDFNLVDKLEYKTPNLIAEIILKLKSGAELGSVLDLGCGTGLAAVALSGLCQNIEGIDLSRKMLRQADQKNVYDKLSHTGIVEYLSEAALDFDLFIAADVFVYVGELSEVFRLIKSRNNRKGWLAFSTEHTEKKGFSLEVSARYSHSKSYIESLCAEFDYQVLHFSKANLRKEKGEFLTGGIYVLEF